MNHELQLVTARSLMDHLEPPFFFQCTNQEVYQVHMQSGKSLIRDRPGGLLNLGSKTTSELARFAHNQKNDFLLPRAFSCAQ